MRSYNSNNNNNNNNGSSGGKSSLFQPKKSLVRGNSNPTVPAEESNSNLPKLVRHKTSVKNIKTEHDEDDDEDSNVTGMFAMTRSCKVDFDSYGNNNMNSNNNTYARRTSILKNSLKSITMNGKNATTNNNNNNNENMNNNNNLNNGIHYP